MPARSTTVGVTVLGDFLLSEGVDAVLENLIAAGVTAVATNPTVTAAAPEGTGSFQPPSDAGSSPRTFDRPLFGRHALWVHSAPSYRPDESLYRDSPYGPRQVRPLTDASGDTIALFVERATAAGLAVYFQVGAVQPSGLRDEDRPRLPDGRLAADRMADTGCLASPAIRAYNRAYVRDLIQHYPQIRGFRIDWPEYPCYTLNEVFQDFHPDVESFARRHGFDFDRIHHDVSRLHTAIQQRAVNPSWLTWTRTSSAAVLGQVAQHAAGLVEWLRLKAALSNDLIRDWREILDDQPGERLELTAHAFMPPFSVLTGFDFATAATLADEVAPKLYTMHWSQMVDFWARPLLEQTNGVSESSLVRWIADWLDLADDIPANIRLADYGYPAPDEAHPIPNQPQLRKIRHVLDVVRSQADPTARVCPLVHGYGPLDDFSRRLELITDTSVDGVWLNRYGYLSDAKLQVLQRVGLRLKSAS